MAVDLYQVLLGGIAVAIMVLVPILSVLLYDLLAGRWDGAIQRRARRSSAAHRRAVRELRHQQGVPIEQLAADLRRLRGFSVPMPIAPPPTRWATGSRTTNCYAGLRDARDRT